LAINWFRGGRKTGAQEYTIDDLIVLERYDEAGERLLARLKSHPQDLHSHLKLAEVYTQLQRSDKAVDEYIFVAEEYAQDGFHDKGLALLAKAMKLAPLDQTLALRVEKLQREKDLEHARTLAFEGLREAGGIQAGSSAFELQKLWQQLAAMPLVRKLPGESLKRLLAAMQIVRLEPGVPLAREGSADPFLLLIVQGVIEASVDIAGRATVVRTFATGDLLGEAGLFERGTWPADYQATEALTALKLTREGLERCLTGNPDPRGFLETLREQHNDRDVAQTVRRLRSGS
jgi:tetratricopeptide (TPR) repeat protein